MSFLDDKIFGLIRSVADATNTYTARQRIKFTGTVTVVDDPVTNTTTVDVSGGGGGGGTPWDSSPAEVGALASSGSSALYARGDHVHALRSTQLQQIASIATAPWNYSNKEIQNLGAPTSLSSAARLADVSATFWHPPVVAIENGYSTPYTGLVTVDGVALQVGDRYARIAPRDATMTGIFIVQTGAHTRAPDWAVGRVLNGDQFSSTSGTNLAGYCWLVTNSPSAVVGSVPVTFINTNKDDVELFGDVRGFTYNSRVVALRGDPMSGEVLLEAKSLRHGGANSPTFSRVYHEEQGTYFTTPTIGATHNFEVSTGCITAIAQVNFCSNTGLTESFHVRETRKINRPSVPTAIGVVSTQYEPTTPTASVHFTWLEDSVQVTLTAANASDTRWGINLQVFEVSST